MAANQLEIIINQVQLLPPDDLLRLLKKLVELLEQKQRGAQRAVPNYAAFFGAGKGLFATPEEVDQFIRQERDAWED